MEKAPVSYEAFPLVRLLEGKTANDEEYNATRENGESRVVLATGLRLINDDG